MSILRDAIIIFFLAAVICIGCSEDKSTPPSEQPHGIQYVGQYNTPDQATGVIVEGDYAYVADHDSGMQIIDITDPAQPAFTGSYQCPGAIQIDLKGALAYIADEKLYSLEIVDVSDPADPDFVGRFDTLEVLGVRVAGDYAYMGCGSDGFQVVNVADSANPSLTGSCQEVSLLRFELTGNNALVPGENGYTGLFAVDLSDPSDPGVIGGVAAGGVPFEVAVKDNYAYMTCLCTMSDPPDTGYLYVIDISSMASPQKVDSMSLGLTTVADFIAGNYLFVTFVNPDKTSGFHVIDISDPVNAEVIASQLLNVVPWDIWVQNSYVYIAADTAGLMIYRFYP